LTDAYSLRPVADEEWAVIGWLWQAFRQDLAQIVHGLPYEDGRYQATSLADYPSPDGQGYIAWRSHPNTANLAPIAFALVNGLTMAQRSLHAFWVAPAARREGVGRDFAVEVLSRHPSPWVIGFQHENTAATQFWRSVADVAFGQWRERRQNVPGRPGAAADHVIESLVT
jgi:GNAT superfamily N-acetyltransferase